MTNSIERKKARIITKSPIHIGSVEQKVTPFEYCLYGNYVYPLSDEKLSLFLQKNNLIDSYVSEVASQGYKFRLLPYFKNKKIHISERDLLSISNGRRVRLLGDAARLQDYRPFICDGFGNPYLPGTSIKGSIRTAVLYNVLSSFQSTDQKVFERQIVDRIQNTEQRVFRKRSPFEWVQQEFLENFQLSGKNGSPHTDWLRILHITDAYPANLKETLLIPVNVLKKEKFGWKYKTEMGGTKTTIWIECLPPGTLLNLEMGWDCTLLTAFQKENRIILLPKNLVEIMASVEQWSNDILFAEKEFAKNHDLEKWYRNNKANFRIGFASGMISTTMIRLFPEETKQLIRNSAGKNKGNDVAPKSRRIWLKDDQPIPFGWSYLQLEPFASGAIDDVPEFSPNLGGLKAEESLSTDLTKETVMREKEPPQQLLWSKATVVWRPNDQTIFAVFGGKKAEAKIENNRSFVPERFHKKLFEGKKQVTTDILVEPVGNAFRIVSFAEE